MSPSQYYQGIIKQWGGYRKQIHYKIKNNRPHTHFKQNRHKIILKKSSKMSLKSILE